MPHHTSATIFAAATTVAAAPPVSAADAPTPPKYVAKLRAYKTDNNPLPLKINMGAGHGGASGRYDAIREGLSTLRGCCCNGNHRMNDELNQKSLARREISRYDSGLLRRGDKRLMQDLK